MLEVLKVKLLFRPLFSKENMTLELLILATKTGAGGDIFKKLTTITGLDNLYIFTAYF